MRHGSLFSGIGGFDLAAEWMGWENVFHCEWNYFGQKILHYYWPQAIQYHDITQTDFTIHRGGIDILTGGFPCQPYSMAGKRKGKQDERHLWPEMLRAIREIAPRYIVGENVLGLVNWDGGLVFDEVQADLESAGYKVATVVIPAAAKNAPHGRDRVWFVAHNDGIFYGSIEQRESRYNASLSATASSRLTANTDRQRIEKRNIPGKPNQKKQPDWRINAQKTDWHNFPTQSPICGGDDGLPAELDGITFPKWRNESIKGYGNAVVPQVVFEIFKAIQTHDDNH